MNHSDEQLKNDSVKGKDSGNHDADNEVMPKVVPAPASPLKPEAEVKAEPDGNSFADELLSAIFKTTFIALSLIAMLACIIAFALPLTSMRLFNSMGMSERAVDFGEKYISRELKSHEASDGRTAAYTDRDGNMPVLTATPALTNADFMEALYVCNNLCEKMMAESLKSGDEERAKYYAERLEKYTRMYLSLNNLSAVTLQKDRKNIASVPAAVRPVVYSFEHDLHVLNYRARAVLGKTGGITYNNRSERLGVMTTPGERSERLYGTIADTDAGRIALLDEYVDYAAQLGAYLDVEFMRLGVDTDFTTLRTIKVNNPISGNEVSLQVTALNQEFVRLYYGNKLDGDEFSLFIMPLKDATESSNGFTRLYSQLSCFTRYAQLAVDTLPPEENGELHRLYWLRVLSDTSRKLWYMEMLLFSNKSNLGLNSEAITNAHNTCQNYNFVNYKLSGMSTETSCQIIEVYADKLASYIGN